MKTSNKQRELAFLSYLTALEGADADGITNFLEQAQQDEILEQMMLDYHEHKQQRQETPMKTIIPFKLKREQTRRMLQIAGISTFAALMLITVGIIGLLIGLRQPTILDAQNCSVSLANEDHTVNLIGGADIESPMHVGVNNPFTLYLNTEQESAGYQVIFEGLRALIAYDDLVVAGDCGQQRLLTVYPPDALDQSCEIRLEPLQFMAPIENSIYSSFFGSTDMNSPVFGEDAPVILDSPVEGIYPVVGDSFTGGIPSEAVHLTGECTNYPLLYVPPRFNDNTSDNNAVNAQYSLRVDGIRVREQRFEFGIMFYLEPLDEVWVAYQNMWGGKVWTTWAGSWLRRADALTLSMQVPNGFYAPEDGMFSYLWGITGYYYEDQDLSTNLNDEIGWAISEPVTFMANYEHPTIPEQGFDEYLRNGGSYLDFCSHFIESSTGQVYQFYESPDTTNSPSSSTWRWRIVGDDN